MDVWQVRGGGRLRDNLSHLTSRAIQHHARAFTYTLATAWELHCMAIDPTTLSPEELDELLARGIGALGARPRVPEDQLVLSSYELGLDHAIAAANHIESGATVGYTLSPLKTIRHTHHRLAQYLAMGMDETKAARLCNYSTTRISILKSDPAFVELLAFYTTNVQEEFADFVSAAADLNLDMLNRLQEILDESPEKITPQIALEAIRVLSDRTGNSPVQRSVNVNVNADMGDRLRAARERAAAIELRKPLDE